MKKMRMSWRGDREEEIRKNDCNARKAIWFLSIGTGFMYHIHRNSGRDLK